MSPANLAKHLPTCEANAVFAHVFTEPVTSRQVKRFRRSLEAYGLTPESYLAVYTAQNGPCAICRRKNRRRRRLAVDHCHRTGKVRGLLCDACNQLLGMAEESTAVLRAAAEYLEAHDPVAT